VVERTLAWITSCRRCARDYERLPESHEAMVSWAMIAVAGPSGMDCVSSGRRTQYAPRSASIPPPTQGADRVSM
jgi:hypothetical protein